MPSELAPQQQQRPSLGAHRSTTTSLHSDSPSTSPAQHSKHKGPKHVVGGRAHTRVPSNKGLHKLTKAHGNDGGSHTDLKKLARNPSTTSLKKNSSHVSLKRNRSSAEIQKRPKSSNGQGKRPASVHFEIGDQDDAWEEASSSASPALSRSASNPSAKPSANNSQANSQAQSPAHSPTNKSRYFSEADGSNDRSGGRRTADGKIIAEKLLQRTPSHNTTKMSLATATPMGHSPPDRKDDRHDSGTLHGTTFTNTPRIGSKEEVVSRFVGGSGTPSDGSPFLYHRSNKSSTSDSKHDEQVKRASSMGNLTRHDSSPRPTDDDEESSALAPRSRKSSTSHAYIPPQQSRTQQKLWLQRASSNIEPQQLIPGAAVAINGLTGLHGGLGLGLSSSLVTTGYDSRDPRIKIQLERTGLEYLVVRRHQDPVGKALARLQQLPGAEKNRRIPSQNGSRSDTSGSGAGRHGLSQSLKDSRARGRVTTGGSGTGAGNGARSSFEGQAGSVDDSGVGEEEVGVGALLRSIWEKNLDIGAGTD